MTSDKSRYRFLSDRRFSVYGLSSDENQWWRYAALESIATVGPHLIPFSFELVYHGTGGAEVAIASSIEIAGAVRFTRRDRNVGVGLDRSLPWIRLLAQRFDRPEVEILDAIKRSGGLSDVTLPVEDSFIVAQAVLAQGIWMAVGMVGDVRLRVSGRGVELQQLRFDEIGNLGRSAGL